MAAAEARPRRVEPADEAAEVPEELVAALASADKHLVARPGPHARTHPDDEASWQDFLTLNTPP